MQETTKNTIQMFLAIMVLFGGIVLLTMAALLSEALLLTIMPIIIAFVLIIALFWILFPKPLLVTS